MTKTQKIIILAAALLIIAAILYPPYIRSMWASVGWSPQKQGWTWFGNMGYPQNDTRLQIRFDVLSIEIFGILVLAGAGCIITKKR